MHMADALLSPAVGVTMTAVSVGAIAYSVAKIKKEDDFNEKKLPIMAVSGAFVFAAQMINFTIPGTGSSGHIGGGILLAVLLGPYPALLTIASVLLVQCLFFGDGGLLALGCNIFNMGVIMCLFAYPILFRPILRKGLSTWKIFLGSILSVVIGLQVGAFCVVLETLLSGVTELPFTSFVLLMQPIHLAIGIVEGIVTGAVLSFVYAMRPEILDSSTEKKPIAENISVKKIVIALLVLAIVVGSGLSLYASAFPDGLEWSMEGVAGTTELSTSGGIYSASTHIQEATAFMPDYAYKSNPEAGTSVAGLVGGGITLALAGVIGYIIYAVKRRKHEQTS